MLISHFMVGRDLAVTFQFIQDQGSVHSSGLLFPSHGFEYVFQCLDIEDDLFYRRGPLLIEWSLGIFPTSTSKQAPEVWYAFRTEALPSLSRLLSISTARVLRLLTDVTAIACLSQTPLLPLPLANHKPGPASPSHTHTSALCSIYHSLLSLQLVLQDYPMMSPQRPLQLPVSSLHTQELFVYIRV